MEKLREQEPENVRLGADGKSVVILDQSQLPNRAPYEESLGKRFGGKKQADSQKNGGKD